MLLEHPNGKQTTLNRSEFGVTVQLHGISLELEASAPPVSKETRTDQRHWELHLERAVAWSAYHGVKVRQLMSDRESVARLVQLVAELND